ncbi:hypothetical protein ACWDUL_20575 [Nocardia niigatensis]
MRVPGRRTLRRIGHDLHAWRAGDQIAAEEKTTLLREVIWDVGKTGKTVPVALLEPVFVGGTTGTKATLANQEVIRGRDINRSATPCWCAARATSSRSSRACSTRPRAPAWRWELSPTASGSSEDSLFGQPPAAIYGWGVAFCCHQMQVVVVSRARSTRIRATARRQVALSSPAILDEIRYRRESASEPREDETGPSGT